MRLRSIDSRRWRILGSMRSSSPVAAHGGSRPRAVPVVEAHHADLGGELDPGGGGDDLACTRSMTRRTSSAEPPRSAWMKLACLGETSAVPMRRPFRPQASIRRPAESSAGLVNTEPALAPPGWLARRQRTISSMAARPAAGSPGAEAVGGRHHHVAWPPARCGGSAACEVGGRMVGDGGRRQVDDPVGDEGGDGVRAVAAGVHPHRPARPCPARPRPTRGRSAPPRPSVGPASAGPAPPPATHVGAVDPQERRSRARASPPARRTRRRPPAGWSRSPPPGRARRGPSRARATSTRAASSTGSVPRAAVPPTR